MPDHRSNIAIRDETPSDAAAVAALIGAAFAPMPFAAGDEAALPALLREAGAVTLALVAERDGELVGQALFSAASVGGRPSAWHTLGPVAVAPGRQRQGIGSRMIVEGISRLRVAGAAGCIVLGDIGYYGRFGFRPAPGLAPPGEPAEFFMALPFGGELPAAAFGFHPAFASAAE
jgi:putative acetyltransferase